MDGSGFGSPHWTKALRNELGAGARNGRVGSRLVSETGTLRVWLIALEPGERLPFHTHVNDYFWTTTAPGRARSRYADGRVAEMDYAEGDTKHFVFGPGESMTHDLENIGTTVLRFATVEFLGGANPPLSV